MTEMTPQEGSDTQSLTTTHHTLTIRRDADGAWRVFKDGDPGSPEVARGDTISWTAEGLDAYLQFPYFYLFDELRAQPKWTLKLLDGATEVLTVSREAPLGAHRYSVFCVENGMPAGYAQGQSPNEFIVGR